jgi:hypothetical protein
MNRLTLDHASLRYAPGNGARVATPFRPRNPNEVPSIRIIEDIAQLPRERWRELTTGRPGLSQELLKALSHGDDHAMKLAVFVAEDDTGFAAAAVCRTLNGSPGPNPLDSFLYGRGMPVARALRCSTGPVMLFSEPLAIRCSVVLRPSLQGASAAGVLRQLLTAIEDTAATRGHGVAFRGTNARDDGLLRSELQTRGYLDTRGPPTTRLDIQWRDFESYVAFLRQRSRGAAQKARYEFNKNRRGGVVIERLFPEREHAQKLYSLVCRNYQQKNGEDLPYPSGLFVDLIERLPDDFVILQARRGEDVLGMCSFLRSGAVAWAAWMGMTQHADRKDFTYFNFYYHLAAQAPALGIQEVLYGTSAYAAKIQRGCEIIESAVHYRPHGRLGRLAARPYVQIHKAWHGRKYL